MCVVAFAWKCHPRWRLLLVGNRDEFHARPSAALARWPGTGVIAGRDRVEQGTWAGVTSDGRCAVVTNVRDPLARTHAPRSRGELPVSFLRGDSAVAIESVGSVRLAAEPDEFAPFNLVLVDADTCMYLGNHPSIESWQVTPGIHGMSNGGFDVTWPKTLRLTAVLGDWLDSGTTGMAALWRVLRDDRSFPDASLPDTGIGLERERWLSPVFVRGRDYGTRASTIIAIDHDGAGFISERRFGPDGVVSGETTIELGPADPAGASA